MKPIAKLSRILIGLIWVAFVVPSAAQDVERGQQLFDTHCIACHSKGIFEREKPIVGNWSDLTRQVRRWQHVAGQEWSAVEVNDVANYLNERFYKFPASEKQP